MTYRDLSKTLGIAGGFLRKYHESWPEITIELVSEEEINLLFALSTAPNIGLMGVEVIPELYIDEKSNEHYRVHLRRDS